MTSNIQTREEWMRAAAREIKVLSGMYFGEPDDEIADIIAKHAPASHGTEWVSVEERLPEFSGTYLVAVSGLGDDGENYIGSLPADWSPNDKHWHDLRGWGHNEVTHWMTLPSAPEGKKP